MKIGGFQPLTLSDYPGHLAAIVFTQGCNFRCPFCHNVTLLNSAAPAETLMDEKDIVDILKTRRSLLDAVVISGGEPTLQADLARFAVQLKSLGFKVKLDTNGSRPAVLRALLDRRLLDHVAMDIKAPWNEYPRLAGVEVVTRHVRDSLALLLDNPTPCTFRTTFVPGLLAEEDIAEIRAYLPEQAQYVVQSFIPEHAFDRSLCPASIAGDTAKNETEEMFCSIDSQPGE